MLGDQEIPPEVAADPVLLDIWELRELLEVGHERLYRKIREARAEGRTVRQLAAAYGTTTPRIYQILNPKPSPEGNTE